MENTTKTILLSIMFFGVFGAAGVTQAAIFVDNATTGGCSNGSTTYAPATRACGAGSDTVYTTLQNANTGVTAGTSGSPTVINIRSGTIYTLTSTKLTINKAYTTWQKYTSDEDKPIIDGQQTFPSTQYQSMVWINSSTPGVTIDGLEFRRIGNLTNLGAVSGYPHAIWSQGYGTVVRNCYFSEVADAAIFFEYGADCVAEYNETYEAGKCKLDGNCRWLGALSSKGNSGTIFRGNKIHHSGGEGIILLRSVQFVTIDSNVLWDIGRPGIYTDWTRDITIRNNLIYCTNSNSRYFTYNGLGCGPGIRISGEEGEVGWNTRFYIHNNLVAGTINNLSIDELWDGVTWPTYVYFYNNTSVEAYASDGSQVNIKVHPSLTSATNVFENNIIQQTTGTIASVPAGPIFDYNKWSKATDTDAQGPNDPAVGNPGLIGGIDFTAPASGTVTGREFALSNSSLAKIGADSTVGETYANGLDPRATFTAFNQTPPLVNTYPRGTIWEFGAFAFVDASGLAAPGGLSVR